MHTLTLLFFLLISIAKTFGTKTKLIETTTWQRVLNMSTDEEDKHCQYNQNLANI